MPVNYAAKVTGAGKPLQVIESPYPTCGPDEIIIENKAFALNPADWALANMDIASHPIFNTEYPFIPGEDCAGIVVEAGPGVASVAKGDRVIAQANGVLPQIDQRGGFQKYAVVPWPNFGKIPAGVPFREAVVLPLGMVTAARGLFEKNQLAMALPPSSEGRSKTLLVWGGSSSVGVNATQLAAAGGYEVVAVASRHNFALCKSVGASSTFDYKEANFIDEAAAALKGKDLVGCFDAIGGADTCKAICEILEKSGTRRRLVSVKPGSESLAPEGFHMTSTLAGSDAWVGIASYLFNWVGEAMEKGLIQAKPEPWIMGHGLENLQKGFEQGVKGYSGKKLVVTL
jgi:NADPH:quinone reductase-like Zn-dependent oxidoreductase